MRTILLNYGNVSLIRSTSWGLVSCQCIGTLCPFSIAAPTIFVQTILAVYKQAMLVPGPIDDAACTAACLVSGILHLVVWWILAGALLCLRLTFLWGYTCARESSINWLRHLVINARRHVLCDNTRFWQRCLKLIVQKACCFFFSCEPLFAISQLPLAALAKLFIEIFTIYIQTMWMQSSIDVAAFFLDFLINWFHGEVTNIIWGNLLCYNCWSWQRGFQRLLKEIIHESFLFQYHGLLVCLWHILGILCCSHAILVEDYRVHLKHSSSWWCTWHIARLWKPKGTQICKVPEISTKSLSKLLQITRRKIRAGYITRQRCHNKKVNSWCQTWVIWFWGT